MCLQKTQKTKHIKQNTNYKVQCLPDEEVRTKDGDSSNGEHELKDTMEAQRERSCKACQNEETRFR